MVAIRAQVLDKIHPNTRSGDEIFSELAEACGVGKYFDFTVEELCEAQLNTVGLTLDQLREAGTLYFEDKKFEYGSMPKWTTPTEKIQFASEACKAAGLSATPTWIPPKAVREDGELTLIGGKQAIHSHNQTVNTPELMEITKKYDLTRVWINADVAASLGIVDGDEVEVSNAQHTGRVRAKVTQRMHPNALYMPSHYGCSVPEQRTAYNVGLRQMDFVPFQIEPGYGGVCSQETTVKVRKVGA